MEPEPGVQQSLPAWRLRLGGIIFVVGWASPLLIPAVTASDLSIGSKTALLGGLFIGIPEIATLAAVAILGKAGFAHLTARLLGFLRAYGPPHTVSLVRHRVGLVMFGFPLLFGWLAPYVGHWIPGYREHPLACGIAGDALLLVGLFTLGGEFWDKLRGLFVHGAHIRLPQGDVAGG